MNAARRKFFGWLAALAAVPLMLGAKREPKRFSLVSYGNLGLRHGDMIVIDGMPCKCTEVIRDRVFDGRQIMGTEFVMEKLS